MSLVAIRTRALALPILALVAVVGFFTCRWGSRDVDSTVGSRRTKVASPARARSVVDAWRGSGSQAPGSIAGVVRDGDGQAVMGALVALVVAGAYEDLQDKTSIRPQGVAVADQNGAFRFTNAPPGQYLLTATAEGWLPAERTGVALLAGETIDDLELRLSRGGVRLHGRVFDAGGGQIGGTSVRALALGAGGRPDGARTFVAAAGPDGEYRLVLARGRYRVVADADGYSPQDARISLDSDRTQDFRLVPGARITGRAVDPNGAEVAGATVRIESDAVILRPSRAVVSRTTERISAGASRSPASREEATGSREARPA